MIKLILLTALVCAVHTQRVRKMYKTPGVTEAEKLIQPPLYICSLSQLAEKLKLNSSYELKIEGKIKLPGGLYRVKLRIYYEGIPIRDFILQASIDQTDTFTGAVSGYVPNITLNTTATITPSRLTQILTDYVNEVNQRADVEDACSEDLKNVTFRKEISIDFTTGKATLVYFVRALLATNVLIRFPRALIHAVTGTVIQASVVVTKYHDGDDDDDDTKSCLKFRGGNDKCPGPDYGPGPNEVCLNATISDGYTILSNNKVQVYTLNGKVNKGQAKLVKFKTSEGPNDAINGARSPAVDAYYYGSLMPDFLQEWGNAAINRTEPIQIFVHVGVYFANAFYDGRAIIFGDGSTHSSNAQESRSTNITLYPLTTAEGVAHEVCHILTDSLGNFNFRDEGVALSEAFSDICAKSFSAYLDKTGQVSNWSFCYCSVKSPNDAIRYFDFPTKDNFTIDNLNDYANSNISPNRGMGVFNKAFYCLVKLKGLNIKDVFRAVVHANLIYWGESTGFLDGACGIYKASSDLSLTTAAFSYCFLSVGIDLSFCNLNGTRA